MDRSSSEGETDIGCHSKKLKARDEVHNEDFISGLPDAVLVHILSFLPLKDAIKTVLIRRFGKMWLDLPVLHLDTCGYHDERYYNNNIHAKCCDCENFMGIIRQVWNHQSNTTLDKVRLRFPFARAFSKNKPAPDPDNEDFNKWVKEKNTADQINEFIGYAIGRKVKVLDLNFIGCLSSLSMKQCHQLPDVFWSNHLTCLRLAFCDISSCEKLNLQALRVLYLSTVSLTDEVMAKVFLGCPFLEHLHVVCCYGLVNLNCGNQKNLKKLIVNLGCGDVKHLYISCPHVVSLEISGKIECATLLDVSSLVDASIKFHHNFEYEESTYLDVLRLLMKVRHCENISLCDGCVMVLSIYKLHYMHHCPHFRWKKIKLELDLKKGKLRGLSCLLQGSLNVETLDIYIDSASSIDELHQAMDWIWEYDFDGENFWDSQVATLPCLETITIQGWVHDPDVFQLVKFLLKNTPKLQNMVVSNKKTFQRRLVEEPDRLSSEQMIELERKLSMFPKASSRSQIHFS